MKDKTTTIQCEVCEDTGEVVVSSWVYPDEPYMADIETQVCLCLSDNEEDYD